MAKKSILDKYPPGTVKYPWATWTNGKWHELEQGVDFHTSKLEAFRAHVCHYARKHGFKPHTRKISDTTLAIFLEHAK